MHTSNELKSKLIDYMMEFDLSKLRIEELIGYAEIVSKISAIDKTDYFDAMLKIIGNTGFGNKAIETKSDDALCVKEVTDNA